MPDRVIEKFELSLNGYYEINREHQYYDNVLYAYAYALNKYPRKERSQYLLCSVCVATHSLLNTKTEGKEHHVYGMCCSKNYSPLKKLSVFVSNKVSLDTVYGMSVLVHELVHSFQYIDDPWWTNKTEAELQARRIQSMFVYDQGYDVKQMMGSYDVSKWSVYAQNKDLQTVSFFKGDVK